MENENQKSEKKLSATQKKIFAVLVVLAVVIVGVVAITGSIQTSGFEAREQVFKGDKSKVIEQSEERENTYIIGASQLPTATDSYLQAMEGALVINELVYPGLAKLNSGDYEYVLAECVQFSDNGKTATVKLSTKAVFSDGCKITAEDVIYTYHYLASSEVVYDEQTTIWCIEGAEDYYYENSETITGIKKVSDNEVKITFKEESLDNLEIFTIPMLHPTSHEYESVNLETENLGAGSYKIDSFLPYEEAVLVKNEYGNTSVKYETIEVVTADLSKLKEQEIDTMIIPELSREEIEALGAYDIYCAYGSDRDFLIFNLDEETMAEEENRTMFAEALDREELFEKCFENGRFSYGIIAGDKEKPNYNSLAKSGKSAEGLEIVVPGTYSGTEMVVLNEVKAQLEEAGATIVESGENSVTYYCGRVEDLMASWELPGFFEDLNGKTLVDVGDLLEQQLVDCAYVIPLHNACYYTISLCTKAEIGILDNRY